MLHIHNGDSSADIARQSSLPGEHFAWREALIEGPSPAGVTGQEWRSLRSKHLTESYGVDSVDSARELKIQEDKLASYPEHDEVILWFEHDLFCQTNLIYLLNWFTERELGNTKLSLICVGDFPGLPNFRGLGELSPRQMVTLFDARHEVSTSEMALARLAWEAYCSPDPTAIQTLLETDTSAMPFLKPAMRLHLERFPFVSNGLGRIENRALELIHDGSRSFVDLFPRFGHAEPTYGLGDVQFWNTLRRMGEAQQPFLNIKSSKSGPYFTSDDFHRITVEITEAGDAALNSQADFVECNGIDTWLGGVHLLGKNNVWRWDDRTHNLTRS